ncbi:NAD(P)H-binding protein [Sulfuriroseicoccus oceanibius]|uniref:NAD(P)H-binding protein n=1 Tax=Sulfuriroseicoccus oceanibius TaxID=2707525 RepID=A0A6B3LDS4_9BACT|nr:NAD(P)H-binding protein [Sulfuriroseicoccus oceanibius]QQL45705.1 NAD(P)H-binding protein [Sulfuriroseicoccus oceanibius]
MKEVAVFGATGATGRELVRQLAAGEGLTVHAIVRRPLPAEDRPNRVIEHVVPTMAPEHFPDLPHLDAVFCALGTTIAKAGSKPAFTAIDHNLVVAVGEWTKARHCPQLHVISSLGATTAPRNFYLRTKGETEHNLEALDLPSLTIYQPSLLHAPQRDEFRLGERLGYIALAAISWLPFATVRRIQPVPVATLAACMIAHAKNPHPGCHRVTSETIRHSPHP